MQFRCPQFPDDLQARFGDRWFAPVDPPGFLDCEGTELVLIGVAGERRGDLLQRRPRRAGDPSFSGGTRERPPGVGNLDDGTTAHPSHLQIGVPGTDISQTVAWAPEAVANGDLNVTAFARHIPIDH